MTNFAKPLDGKWTLVTGSSSGIGQSIAQHFSRSGANVIVHGNRKRDAAESLAAEISQAGQQSEVLISDLSEPDAPMQLVEQAWNIAPIDVWVNNAGVDVLTGDAAGWSFEEKFAALWPVDVAATMQLSRAAGALMKQRGEGVILNIGWDQTETGMEGDSGEMFAATKGAVTAFTRSLAQSLAPEVRVNCIAPGWIKTDWGEEASEYWQQRAIDESLLRRWGTPADIANAACFLASPQASFITGQVLRVNGGQRR